MEKSRHRPPGAATCHPKWMTGSMADFLNPNLNLITRTWIPIAETRDLKMKPPGQPPGFRSPFACWHAPTANRYPPAASTFARVSYFASAAVIDFTTALPSVAEPSGLK